MDDEDFSSQITRDDFEAMCKPMMDKVRAVLEGAKTRARVSLDRIDSVEMVGGASRVPWVKAMCSKAFGGKDLATTMNADESVARGCTLQAAILSPLYKVRDFKVEDFSPFVVSIGWMSAANTDAGEAETRSASEDRRTSILFPQNSMTNILKLLTFYRKASFELQLSYVDHPSINPSIPKLIGKYNIQLPAGNEMRKVKVRVRLTPNGTYVIEGAHVVEEEEYIETSKEKREVPPEIESTTDPEIKEKKPSEKRYETVEVKRERKRIKRPELVVTSIDRPGLSFSELERQLAEEAQMQADMLDMIECDEKRNDLEAYIFTTRENISENGKLESFIHPDERIAFSKALASTEDWLNDNLDALKDVYINKLCQLKETGDKVDWIFKESKARPEWIKALSGTIQNYRRVAEVPNAKYEHIAPEKLQKIVTKCDAIQKWLSEMQAEQAKLQAYERPALQCFEMEKRNKELAKFAGEILGEAKPRQPKLEAKPEAKPEAKLEAKPASSFADKTSPPTEAEVKPTSGSSSGEGPVEGSGAGHVE